MKNSQKDDNQQFVGTNTNIDGSSNIDSSENTKNDEPIDSSFLEKEDSSAYDSKIQEILTKLEKLDNILNPIKFNPSWMNLNTELNNNSNEINIITQNLHKLMSNEYKSISIRAKILLRKMILALRACKEEQQNPDGDVIYTGIFTWLEKDGPSIMNNLIALKNKVQ